MINQVWHTGERDFHAIQRVCVFFAQIAVAAFSMLTIAGTSAQSISIADVTSVWERTVIENVTVEFAVKTHSSIGPIVFPVELGVGGIKVAPLESFQFNRIADLGMRLDQLSSPARKSNLIDGYGIALNGPSNAMDGLNSAVINLEGSSDIQRDWTTDCMLYWIEPLSTKTCWLVACKPNQTIQTSLDMDLGDVAVIQLGDDLTVALAKKFEWRPVLIQKGGATSKRVNVTELRYSRSQNGELLLDGFTKRLISGKQVAHLSAEVTSRKFGTCSRSAIELQIPNYTLVTNLTGPKEHQHIVRKDGSIRPYDHSKEPFAKNWSEIINSEPPGD